MPTILCGDAITNLKDIPDESVNCCFTSPNYWQLRDNHTEGQFGLEKTVALYLRNLLSVFVEVARVLHSTGTLFVNISDKYINREPCCIPEQFLFRMREIGFKHRQTIIWHKPNSGPKTAWDRFGIYDWEYIYFFTLKKSKYYFERLFKSYSNASKSELTENYTGKATREYKKFKAEDPSKAKKSICKSMRRNPGSVVRSVWSINTKKGYGSHTSVFPEKLVERVILAGCPEFVCSECHTPRRPIFVPSAEYAKFLGKSWTEDTDKDKQLRMEQGFQMHSKKVSCDADYRKIGYTIDCECNAPFIPGVMLDPFAGSCTVGVVAEKLNRDYILIDINSDYCREGQQRIDKIKNKEVEICQ